MERIRNNRIAIEDRTRIDMRPTGSYKIVMLNPHSVEFTRLDNTHREAVVRARSLTRFHRSATLYGPTEIYDPPALD